MPVIELDEIEAQEKQFSGTELDEPEGPGIGMKPGGESVKNAVDVDRRKKILWSLLAIGLIIVTAAGYSTIRKKEGASHKDAAEKVSHEKRFAIPKARSVEFGSFLIPFSGSRKICYISLSFAVDVPDANLRKRILKDRSRIRGIIYDLLLEDLSGYEDAPPPGKIRKRVLRAFNSALSAGRVGDLHLIDYLAV